MLEIRVIIKSLNINHVLFLINASKKELYSVYQAIEGERLYNGAELDFCGLIYPKNPIKDHVPLLKKGGIKWN